MPIAQRTATSGTAAASASFSVTLPASTAAGDFLIVGIANAGTTGPSAPTGWTRFYSASAGSAQCLSVYSAQYSAGLTLSFTNAASAAAWVCDAYWMASRRVEVDTSLAATNTTNNATLPTGAPVTGTVAGDYEALVYAWTSNATITTVATGSTRDLTQANSTTISVTLGHNNTTSLSASTASTAFSHTLSASNSRKSGLGVNLIPRALKDLTATTSGASTASGTIGKQTVTYKNVNGTAGGTAVASAVLRRLRALVAAAAGSSSTLATVTRKRGLQAVSAGTALTTAAPSRKRAVSGAVTGLSTATATLTGKRALSAAAAGSSSATGAIGKQQAAIYRNLIGTAAGGAAASGTVGKQTPIYKDLQATANARAIATGTIGIVGVLPTTTVIWVGDHFERGATGTLVTWDSAHFQTNATFGSGSFGGAGRFGGVPQVIWEDDRFKVAA